MTNPGNWGSFKIPTTEFNKIFSQKISAYLVNLFYLKTRIGTFNSSWLMTPAREECRNWRPVISHGKKGWNPFDQLPKKVCSIFCETGNSDPLNFCGWHPHLLLFFSSFNIVLKWVHLLSFKFIKKYIIRSKVLNILIMVETAYANVYQKNYNNFQFQIYDLLQALLWDLNTF